MPFLFGQKLRAALSEQSKVATEMAVLFDSLLPFLDVLLIASERSTLAEEGKPIGRVYDRSTCSFQVFHALLYRE